MYYGNSNPPAGGYGGYAGYAHPYVGYGALPAVGPSAAITRGAPSLKWFVLGSFIGMWGIGIVGGAASAALGERGETIGGIITILVVPLFISYLVTTLVWIYKSWEMLPESMRYTASGTHVSPGRAVGCLFIPFYNLYWYFVVSAGLCSALNMALISLGSSKRASSGLGTAAAIFQVIPYVNLLIAPFVWLVYMFNVESAKSEYRRLSGHP